MEMCANTKEGGDQQHLAMLLLMRRGYVQGVVVVCLSLLLRVGQFICRCGR